jgi:Mg/Co/Ni transporter MgtE
MTEFLQLDQDKQRQILGELLFPQIKRFTNDVMAPKVTGMLIDLSVLEVSEILELLENEALLKERCDEAMTLIDQSEGK